jgi:hypothetical protein
VPPGATRVQFLEEPPTPPLPVDVPLPSPPPRGSPPLSLYSLGGDVSTAWCARANILFDRIITDTNEIRIPREELCGGDGVVANSRKSCDELITAFVVGVSESHDSLLQIDAASMGLSGLTRSYLRSAG